MGKARDAFISGGIKGFFHKLMGFIRRQLEPVLIKTEPYLYRYASWKISREATGTSSAKKATDFLFNTHGHLIKPKQIRWEITETAKIVENLKPKTVLEIGTAKGGTLFLWSRLASEDATIVSIDMPWENGGGYPNWKTDLYQKFSSPKQKLTLLRADSHQTSTLENLRSIIAKDEIDLLFIDGDHTYDGVKKDYEMYSPLVRDGGIIAMHDIAKHDLNPECQVDRFWKEIKQGKNTKEFIISPPADWGGIGVIEK